jgi:NADH:ubiquinone oxidoreductase subunit 3 (subunit A)
MYLYTEQYYHVVLLIITIDVCIFVVNLWQHSFVRDRLVNICTYIYVNSADNY